MDSSGVMLLQYLGKLFVEEKKNGFAKVKEEEGLVI